MIAATGVSRTVVREAVAALAGRGLVVTRQGVGAFVADNARRPFRIELRRGGDRCAKCSTSWSCAPASRSKPPASPPSADRRRTIRRTSPTASMPIEQPRSSAARMRVDQDFALPLQHRRGDRESAILGAFSSISDASSFRGRRSTRRPGIAERVPNRRRFKRSIATSCRRSAAGRCRRRAPRCAGTCSNSRKRYQRLAAKLGNS